MTMMHDRVAPLIPDMEMPGGQALVPLEEVEATVPSHTVATTANGTEVDLGPNEGLVAALEKDPIGTRLRMLGNSGLTLGDLDLSEIADDVSEHPEWYPPFVEYDASGADAKVVPIRGFSSWLRRKGRTL